MSSTLPSSTPTAAAPLDTGAVDAVTSAAPGRHSRRRILVAFAVALALGGVGGLVTLASAAHRVRSGAWVRHTTEVLAALDDVGEHLATAEATQRGFLLTGDPSFLDRGRGSPDAVRAAFSRARVLVRDDPQQRRRLDGLGAPIVARLAFIDSTLALAADDEDAAVARVRTGRGELLARRIGAELAIARAAEGALLQERMAAERAADVRLTLLFLVTLAGAAAAATLGVLALRHDARETERALAAVAAARQALRERESQLRGALDASLDAFLLYRAVRDGEGAIAGFVVADCNAPAGILEGMARYQLVGRPLETLFPLAAEQGLPAILAKVVATRAPATLDYRTADLPADARRLRLQIVPVLDGVAVTARDVTDEHRVAEALRAQAQHDELTGLHNRRGFLAAAEREWMRARREGRGVVVAYLDLDRFKAINDAHGHGEGDAALRAMADVLRTVFRGTDVVGRLGGDEFAAFVVPGGPSGARVDVQAVERTLRERIALHLAHANALADGTGRAWALATSIGTATIPPPLDDTNPAEAVQALLAAADERLYREKQGRRAA